MTRTADPASRRLGDLVVEAPRRARLFERLQLDHCCGGARTLADACRERSLDVDTIVAVLDALDQDGAAGADEHDVGGASIGELCDHIVSAHHEPLRSELPRVAGLADKVVRAHGDEHAELGELQRVFDGMAAELEEHLGTEEAILFPACRALETDPGAHVDEALLAEHESEHAEVGDALARLRALSGEYDMDTALCNTHRALLESLHALELDLHQHVHEENNVLFARVRARDSFHSDAV